MFEMAQRTPSWCNSQAWQVDLLIGQAADAFADALYTEAKKGVTTSDIATPTAYDGVYRDRRRASGFGLYGALGIAREDTEGRARQMLENFRFFGAPHAAIVSTPKALGTYGAVDCGGYVTILMLAAESLGIASIAQAAIAELSPFIHDYLGIPEDRDIVCAVSFGYEDPAHPANKFRTDRVELSDVVHGL
jgi:nitroreductase